jgi:hypothetical protein
VAAYDDDKLIGSFFAAPHALRIGSTVHPVTLSSWCTVDPDYRLPRLTVDMIESLRRRHLETGRVLSLGLVNGSPTSIANKFWALYGKACPQNYRYIMPISYWAKILDPAGLVRAGVAWWERGIGRVLGPVLKPIPWARGSSLRPYEPRDLEACLQLLERANAGFDWAVSWSAESLPRQLEGPLARTLVLERDGEVRAMVNYHRMRVQGTQPMEFALIDLCAMPGVGVATASQVFGGVCARLRDEGVGAVVCQQSAMFPTAALAANVFIPLPVHDQLIALFPQPHVPLDPPRTWSLLLR